ncbi:hypothetical protein [Botrimarina mediterranea]|uniref:hypothetical protein n=1 Tax=Botrimarina mediterranea TaxID=2528022 RepID=UPI001188139F|nr:hypothetical protein K2D_19430 [Planctomycetes bacterium K2D]
MAVKLRGEALCEVVGYSDYPTDSCNGVFVLEGVAVLVAHAADTARATLGGHDAESLSRERLQHYLDLGEAPFCDTLVERLDDDRISCFGVEANGSLLSFAWLCKGVAEAEMNYGRQPSTATPLLLSSIAAFVFHAYTAPHVRSQGLLGAVLRKAAASLLEVARNRLPRYDNRAD